MCSPLMVSHDPATWPEWIKPGQRIWWGYRDARIEERGTDSLIIRRTRRAGFISYALTAQEVATALRAEVLREYVKRPRRPRSPTSTTPLP
jgi:hypothetical protein